MPFRSPAVKNHACPICPKQFATAKGCDQHQKAKHSSSMGHPSSTSAISPTAELNSVARKFHDNNAAPPKTRHSDPNVDALNQITSTIYEKLKEKGYTTKRICVGSAYERTSIQKQSDFDVVFRQIDTDLEASKPSKAPSGYYQLKRDDQIFSPTDYIDKHKGEVQKIINNTDFGKYELKLHDHGPALSVSVKEDKIHGQYLPSIDLVPSVEIKDGVAFVVKFPKPGRSWGVEHQLWKRCNSYEARQKMASIDSGNKCFREVYRVGKVIRNREPNLKHISSFQLKCVIFHLSDTSMEDWSREKIGEHTVEMIRYLAQAYERGKLVDHFNREENLLSNTEEDTLRNTANRLKEFVKDPRKMFVVK